MHKATATDPITYQKICDVKKDAPSFCALKIEKQLIKQKMSKRRHSVQSNLSEKLFLLRCMLITP